MTVQHNDDEELMGSGLSGFIRSLLAGIPWSEHAEGVEELQQRYGEWLVATHFPGEGTPTQPIEAGYKANVIPGTASATVDESSW